MILRRKLAVILCLAVAAIAAATHALAQNYVKSPVAVAVHATPVDSFDTAEPSRTRFGALEFRGGLALTSSESAFGGISGLRVEADGAHFLAVTDNGSWLRGRIVYSEGRPSGIADAEMAPLLGSDGKPLAARGWYDAESLENDNGTLYVGLERVEKIVRFDYARDGLKAQARVLPAPDDFRTFTYNKSLECLAMPPQGSPLAGTLIAVTERSLDAAGNHRAYLLDGVRGEPPEAGRAERFSVKRSDGFDVSDCTILPPADLLLLERHFSPARGILMRIRRIPLAALKPGALVDGAQLITADLGFQIDNMEGIAVHKNAQGETIITMVADDNFSLFQRNLLLQFALVAE
jgi:hypothetical protein